MALTAYADADHAGCQDTRRNTMADINIPANDAPVEQTPDVAPPIRTDDQIMSVNKWVPIGKSNCVLDVLKSQRNPIFPIVVALLKNTNFFRAFIASSTILAIYIQQFWDTMCFNSSTGLYSCQLDDQWFNLHKDLLKDALDITPTNDNNHFVAPPFSDTSNLVLQILWGITHRSNTDYAERIWEKFVQSIQTFLTNWKNLATASRGKKKTTLLLIPNVRFTKLIIHHLRTKHNIHPRTGSPLHYSQDENVLNTLRFVGKDEEGGATESSKATKVTKPKAAKVTKPAGDPNPKKRKLVKETPDDPLPTKRSKAGLVGKRRKAKSPLRLIDEPSDEGVPVEEPVHDDEEADLQRALELSLKEQEERTQGPARPVVLREPDSDKFQPLPKEATKINARNQEEGQARPNLVYKMKVRLDQTLKPEHIDEEFTTTAYLNVQENLKLLIEDQVILEEPASSTGTLSSFQNLDKDLSFTD
ncbi:retrovirus-related pol polyprotein from transposon TNT 1-94 [Tanacetum coccineum]